MPPLGLLIKPASGQCNMRCSYCFYRDEMENRSSLSLARMDEETTEYLIKRAFEFAEESCSFGFQGGEPTLAGLEYFQRFSELVKRYNVKQIPVNYSIQTNGYLINQAWADFFAEHHYLVGLSLDGVQIVHDSLRRDYAHKATFSKVMRAAERLRKVDVPFNILTVVTAPLAKHIKETYAFYQKNGFSHQQYIPCLDPIGEDRGLYRFSLTPELYGRFLCDLFDLWYHDLKHHRYCSIRYFDNLLMILHDTLPESCGMLGCCSIQNVVEADGGVYPCDFYALDHYRLGNVKMNTFEEIYEKRKQSGFLQRSLQKAPQCLSCPWKNICRGGCIRDRDRFNGGELGLNYFCRSYQMFFEHSFSRLQEIARGSF